MKRLFIFLLLLTCQVVKPIDTIAINFFNKMGQLPIAFNIKFDENNQTIAYYSNKLHECIKVRDNSYTNKQFTFFGETIELCNDEDLQTFFTNCKNKRKSLIILKAYVKPQTANQEDEKKAQEEPAVNQQQQANQQPKVGLKWLEFHYFKNKQTQEFTQIYCRLASEQPITVENFTELFKSQLGQFPSIKPNVKIDFYREDLESPIYTNNSLNLYISGKHQFQDSIILNVFGNEEESDEERAWKKIENSVENGGPSSCIIS